MSFHYPRCTINPCTCDDQPLPPMRAPRPASEIHVDWDQVVGNRPGAYGHAAGVLASLGPNR